MTDTMKNGITILIADDTEIARRGLHSMLETAEDIRIVGETGVLREITQLLLDFSPSVLLIDLKWDHDESAGWSMIQKIKIDGHLIKIIAISAYPNLLVDAKKAGADSCVTKNIKREEFLELIRTVAISNTNG